MFVYSINPSRKTKEWFFVKTKDFFGYTKKHFLYHKKNAPALHSEDAKVWYKHGVLHRENLPSIEYADGRKEWFFEGKKYHEIQEETEMITISGDKINSVNDMPAVVYKNGTKMWYEDGKIHRDNDLPAIIYSNGDQEWWRKGQRHRDFGPAVIYGDNHYWYMNGFLTESEGLFKEFNK